MPRRPAAKEIRFDPPRSRRRPLPDRARSRSLATIGPRPERTGNRDIEINADRFPRAFGVERIAPQVQAGSPPCRGATRLPGSTRVEVMAEAHRRSCPVARDPEDRRSQPMRHPGELRSALCGPAGRCAGANTGVPGRRPAAGCADLEVGGPSRRHRARGPRLQAVTPCRPVRRCYDAYPVPAVFRLVEPRRADARLP